MSIISWWPHCTRCGAQGPIVGNAMGLCPSCEAASRSSAPQLVSPQPSQLTLSEADVERIAEAVATQVAAILTAQGGAGRG